MNDNHVQINNTLKSSRHYYAHNNKKKLNYYSRYSPKRNKVVQQNESPLTDRSPDQIKKARQSRKLSQNICQGQKYKPMFQLISEEELIANNKIQEIKAFQPLIYENRGQIFIDQDEQQQTGMKNIQEKSQQINNKKNNNDSIYILDDDDEQQKNYSKQSNNFSIKQDQKVSQKHSKNNQPLKYISNFPQNSQNMLNWPLLNSKSQNQSFSIESDLSIIQQKWNSLFEQEINLDSILVLPTNDESNKIKNKEQKDYIDQKVDNNHHHDFINKQQQKLPSFQNYLQSQQFTNQPQNIREYQRNKTFNRHFTFGSQIHLPEIMKQQQQEQEKEKQYYYQTSINFNSQNKAIQQQNQSSPLLKKLFSAEFAQKIINQDNIKKSKYKSRTKKMSNSQRINSNFKKQKSQIKKIQNIINHEESSQKIRKNLFKQQFYEDIKEEKVSSKKQSGMNTQRSTGQVIQLMSDQIKKFQAYPIQPQNLKVSRKKHDKLIKEQRWQKTIHQLLEKTTSRNEAEKNSELEKIKINNLSSKNSKNQNNYNNISNKKSQISSVKARNSSQSSQLFSNQQQQDFINVNVSDQKRQPIDIQMMMQNEVEDYNQSSMNESSKKYSDLKDSQTDDMSRRIRFQRQSKKQKSLQKKSKENQSQFNQQTEEITKVQNSALFQSTYTQIFLKKLNRPHKKSVDVQESIIFLQNQSQQQYKQKPTMLSKDKEQGLNEVIDKDYKKQLKIGKDKEMVESYEIQDQSKEDHTILDQEDHLKLKKQQSQNRLENNKFGKKQLTLNARSTSFKYKDQQKTNNTNNLDQLQKLFQESKSLQLLRQTIPTLPPELVNTYLTIYNKLLVTQAQHQARRSRQKMLLDILQMLIYFNKKKIDCESFIIQPFEEDFKQNLIEKQKNQQKSAIKIETEGQTNLNDQCSESGTNEDMNNLSVSQKTFKNQRKTIKMNQILLKGMIKQLASKII